MSDSRNKYIRLYYSDVVRFIQARVRSAADVKDIAQATFIAFDRAPQQELIREPLAYLYRIAANEAFRFIAKKQRSAQGLVRFANRELPEEFAPSAESLVLSTEESQRLRDVLEELPPKRRAVLILSLRDEMTQQEIAELLDISISMVKKHLVLGLAYCYGRLPDLRRMHHEK